MGSLGPVALIGVTAGFATGKSLDHPAMLFEVRKSTGENSASICPLLDMYNPTGNPVIEAKKISSASWAWVRITDISGISNHLLDSLFAK